jgi:hypothetical protein
VLLSDDDTTKWLSENFVLSWENVREPAKVTIDFGDGKVLKRTLAGNTAFYLTTSDGAVVDVFPGVYTPQDFKKLVTESLEGVAEAEAIDAIARAEYVKSLHTGAFYQAYLAEANTTMSKMYVESPILDAMRLAGPVPPAPRVETTTGKAVVEGPILRSLSLEGRPVPIPDQEERLSFKGFASRLVDISKTPMGSDEARRRISGNASLSDEQRQGQIVRLDSRTNVRYVRPAVHLMFRDAVKGLVRPQDLTRTVYLDLLHIDVDDPYLGLADNLIPGTGK